MLPPNLRKGQTKSTIVLEVVPAAEYIRRIEEDNQSFHYGLMHAARVQRTDLAPGYLKASSSTVTNSAEVLNEILVKYSTLRPKDPVQTKLSDLLAQSGVWVEIRSPESQSVSALMGVKRTSEVAELLDSNPMGERLFPNLSHILSLAEGGSFSLACKTLLHTRGKTPKDELIFVGEEGGIMKVTSGGEEKETKRKQFPKSKKGRPITVTNEDGEKISDWFLDRVTIPRIKLTKELLEHRFSDDESGMFLALLSGCTVVVCDTEYKLASYSDIMSNLVPEQPRLPQLLLDLASMGLFTKSEDPHDPDNYILSNPTLDKIWITLLGLQGWFDAQESGVHEEDDSCDIPICVKTIRMLASQVNAYTSVAPNKTALPRLANRIQMTYPPLTPNDPPQEVGIKPRRIGDALDDGREQFTTQISNVVVNQHSPGTPLQDDVDCHIEKEMASNEVNPIAGQSYRLTTPVGKIQKAMVSSREVVGLLHPRRYSKLSPEEKLKSLSCNPGFGLSAGRPDQALLQKEMRMFLSGSWLIPPSELVNVEARVFDEGETRYFDKGIYFRVTTQNQIESHIWEKTTGKSKNSLKFLFRLGIPYLPVSRIRGENEDTYGYDPTDSSGAPHSTIWPIRQWVDSQTPDYMNMALDISFTAGHGKNVLGCMSMCASSNLLPLDTVGLKGSSLKIEMGVVYMSIPEDDWVYLGGDEDEDDDQAGYVNQVFRAGDVFPDVYSKGLSLWLPLLSQTQTRGKQYIINAGSLPDANMSWTLNSVGELTFYCSSDRVQTVERTSQSIYPTVVKTSGLAWLTMTALSPDRRNPMTVEELKDRYPEYEPDESTSRTQRTLDDSQISSKGKKRGKEGKVEKTPYNPILHPCLWPKFVPKSILDNPTEAMNIETLSAILQTTFILPVEGPNKHSFSLVNIESESEPVSIVSSVKLPDWECTLYGDESLVKPLTVDHEAIVGCYDQQHDTIQPISFKFSLTESTTWDCAHEGIQELITVMGEEWFDLVDYSGLRVQCLHAEAEHTNATPTSPPRDGKFWYHFQDDMQPGSPRFRMNFGADLEDAFLRRKAFLVSSQTTDVRYREGHPYVEICKGGVTEPLMCWELAIEIKTSSSDRLAFYRYCHSPLYQVEALGAFIVGTNGAFCSKGYERIYGFPVLAAVGKSLVKIRQLDLQSKMRARCTFGGKQAFRRNGVPFKDWYDDDGRSVDYYNEVKLAWEYAEKELKLAEDIICDIDGHVHFSKTLEVSDSKPGSIIVTPTGQTWYCPIPGEDEKGNPIGSPFMCAELGSDLAGRLHSWFVNYRSLKELSCKAHQAIDAVENYLKSGEIQDEIMLARLKHDVPQPVVWNDLFYPIMAFKSLLSPSFSWAPNAPKLTVSPRLTDNLERMAPLLGQGYQDAQSFSALKDADEQGHDNLVETVTDEDPTAYMDDDLQFIRAELGLEDLTQGVSSVLQGYLGSGTGSGSDPLDSDQTDQVDEGTAMPKGLVKRDDGLGWQSDIGVKPAFDKNLWSVLAAQGTFDPNNLNVGQAAMRDHQKRTTKEMQSVKHIGKLRVIYHYSILPPVRITGGLEEPRTLSTGATVTFRHLESPLRYDSNLGKLRNLDIYGYCAAIKYFRTVFKIPWLPSVPPVRVGKTLYGWPDETRTSLGVGRLLDPRCWSSSKIPTVTHNYCPIYYSNWWFLALYRFAIQGKNSVYVHRLGHEINRLVFDFKDNTTGLDLMLSPFSVGLLKDRASLHKGLLVWANVLHALTLQYRPVSTRKGGKVPGEALRQVLAFGASDALMAEYNDDPDYVELMNSVFKNQGELDPFSVTHSVIDFWLAKGREYRKGAKDTVDLMLKSDPSVRQPKQGTVSLQSKSTDQSKMELFSCLLADVCRRLAQRGRDLTCSSVVVVCAY